MYIQILVGIIIALVITIYVLVGRLDKANDKVYELDITNDILYKEINNSRTMYQVLKLEHAKDLDTICKLRKEKENAKGKVHDSTVGTASKLKF